MDLLRKHAIEILIEFDQTNRQLKTIRDQHCDAHQIKSTDRQRITALTNDIIRWRNRIDYWMNTLLDKPKKKLNDSLKNILRAGIYETTMDEKIPVFAAVNSYVEIAKYMCSTRQANLVNALLRKSTKIHEIKQKENIPFYQWYSQPQWLWNKWIKQFGEEKTVNLAEFFLQSPTLDIRRNNHLLSHDDFLAFCRKHQIDVQSWNSSNVFYRINKNSAALRSLILENKLLVQDRAAGYVVELLDPQAGETILDVCAAPGGKTAYITELLDGRGKCYAFDVDAERIKKMKAQPHLEIDVKNAETDDYPQANAILIDAPCSGTGVMGKKPDIRWRRSEHEIMEFAEKQKRILQHMSQFVKPGGRIVYSTCSLENEENWEVVDAFLKLNQQFYVDNKTAKIPHELCDEKGALFSFPPESNTDGMYAVKLVYGN